MERIGQSIFLHFCYTLEIIFFIYICTQNGRFRQPVVRRGAFAESRPPKIKNTINMFLWIFKKYSRLAQM